MTGLVQLSVGGLRMIHPTNAVFQIYKGIKPENIRLKGDGMQKGKVYVNHYGSYYYAEFGTVEEAQPFYDKAKDELERYDHTIELIDTNAPSFSGETIVSGTNNYEYY